MAERLNNHFQFLDVPRVDPKKKDIEQRKDRYEEIYYPYETREVEHQAHRCLHCGSVKAPVRSTTASAR